MLRAACCLKCLCPRAAADGPSPTRRTGPDWGIVTEVPRSYLEEATGHRTVWVQ